MAGKFNAAYLFGGAAVGAANGLFGGGGGMIAVPVLRAAGKEARASHATAIAVILPACVLSGAVYFFCGLVPLHILLPVAIGVAAGGYFGAKLLPRVSGRTVSLLFAFLMIAAGVKLIV